MNRFSRRSKNNLAGCHEDLQLIALHTLKIIDFAVIEGHRDSEEQDKLFDKGLSKLKWPNSKHNKKPSTAFDIVPCPIDWNNRDAFIFLAGIVKGVSEMLFSQGLISHRIRWGGDWNGNNNLKDQTFYDYPHFELVKIEGP